MGGVFGTATLWLIAWASGFGSGWILAASLFTTLTISIPFSVRFWARRVAKTLPGVATPQTWLFDSSGISVTNEKGQVTISPWSAVMRVTRDTDYGYLEDHSGGKSPLPLAIIGLEAMTLIEQLHADAATRSNNGKSS